ncbi:MAG: hypothetical protein JWO37_840 [Acidimicrobiales bacterium]|jgi:hypothetical protein|nr:hypothetical protein [Acidimicrobiales bacterium]
MRRITALLALLATVTALAGCTSGSSKKAVEHLPAVAPHCEPLSGGACLLPFPSNAFTASDPSSPTGRRLALDASVMPKNTAGTPVDPAEWNRADGFSPGSPILVMVPGFDAAAAHLPAPGTIATSEAPGSAIVLLDATTGTRQPFWVDADPSGLLTIRPAIALHEAHRYVVGLTRNLAPAATWPAFLAIRDGTRTDAPAVETRRAAIGAAIADLTKAGVAKADLALAWDFTVASAASLAGRLLHMRDDAFASLGSNGGAPSFHVDKVDPAPTPDLARRVTGTFTVPRYLTGDGGPGQRFLLGPDGLPTRNGNQQANFVCVIPKAAASKPAQAIVYGHGLLGSASEVDGFGPLAQAGDAVLCGTDWIGMSSADIPNLISVLGDLTRFPTVVDRLQQAVLDMQFLARLLKDPKGFATDPAFQLGGHPAIKPGEVFFNGNSQGGILGGAATAVSTEWTRAVLGVPGMNFSTLIPRSVDFSRFATFLGASYRSAVDQALALALMQLLWDRGEADGYAAHMTDDPYPGTPKHTVLLIEAFGDHQVANVTTQVEARTIGARIHQPALQSGRTGAGDPYWGLDPIPAGAYPGNALVVWDYGSPAPPDAATPPTDGNDPHGSGAAEPRVAALALAFFAGALTDVCHGQACTSTVGG